MTTADLYLRLSDFRGDADGFAPRERKLRAEAKRLGWTVGRVVIENDVLNGDGNGNGSATSTDRYRSVDIEGSSGDPNGSVDVKKGTGGTSGQVINLNNLVRPRPASAFKRRKVVTPSGRTELRVYRPGFRQVLDDLMNSRATAVLCEDLDRAVRDPRDLEDLIDAMAHCRGHARSLSGSLTFTAGGTDSEVTMARVMVTMANKSSRDLARRVASSREILAAEGTYGGGRRPYGYRPDPDSVKYHRTLLQVPAEAAELRRAAASVLAGGSLKAFARDLRDRQVPSVTGAPWSAETLRDVLIKPAIAGLAAHTRDGTTTLHAAAWEPILPRDTWEAVVAVLTAPGRNPATSNAPRWLGSNLYLCGICKTPTLHVTGGKKGPGYVCSAASHIRRHAPETDKLVGMYVAARLNRDDARDLLRPPVRPGVDAGALRAETAKLTAIGERQAAMHAVGDITDAELAAGSRARNARLGKIAVLLHETTTPDPLAEFRDAPDAARVWRDLPLERQRNVLRLLAVVTLLPATRRGRGFDPDSVRVDPVQP